MPQRISRADSRIPLYVVPTDEELMIAQHTLSLLWNRHSSSQSEVTRERHDNPGISMLVRRQPDA